MCWRVISFPFGRRIISVGVKLCEASGCCTDMESERERAGGVRDGDSLPRRLAEGDPSAPRELVERHHAELRRYARALLRDGVAAEDAVQAAFERAFVALGKYPKERVASLSLRAWMYRITLNVVRNAWREGRREIVVAETPESGENHESGEKEAWMDALDALGRLPERQRVAVALRYIEDLPYAGISERTGWPVNTCKTLVRRGVGRLGVLLSDESHENGGRR
jgi:RNA polymerase sigma-70 factor, ECF subfamily